MDDPRESFQVVTRKKKNQQQDRSLSNEELENLSIGDLKRHWQVISTANKSVAPEQLEIMIRKLSSDKFTRLKNENREQNKRLVQKFYTYRKTKYPGRPNSDKLKEIDRLMMLYLCKYSKASMKKKGITPADKDDIKQNMLTEITKIFQEFPSGNSFQALTEISCKFISIHEGWRLLCTANGQKYLASNYLYVYIPYLEVVYHLDQNTLKDTKTGIERVREVFAKLRKENPTGLNSHLYCKIFKLFSKEVKSKRDPSIVSSLIDEALRIYNEIPMKKEFRTPQVHKEILELLFAANYDANTIIQFFNATLKELAEFKEKSHASQYNFMLKFCYGNKHFVSASNLLSEAWDKKILPHPPSFSNNIYEINLHTEGKMGGGTHYHNGIPKNLLPLFVHALISYATKETIRQNIDHEICMRFIPGKPDPELKDDPDYKPNFKTVEEILNCYGLNATIDENNAGCLIVKVSSKELINNPTLKKFYYEGQLFDAADILAPPTLATLGKQPIPPHSPFWDTRSNPKDKPDDNDQQAALENGASS